MIVISWGEVKDKGTVLWDDVRELNLDGDPGKNYAVVVVNCDLKMETELDMAMEADNQPYYSPTLLEGTASSSNTAKQNVVGMSSQLSLGWAEEVNQVELGLFLLKKPRRLR